MIIGPFPILPSLLSKTQGHPSNTFQCFLYWKIPIWYVNSASYMNLEVNSNQSRSPLARALMQRKTIEFESYFHHPCLLRTACARNSLCSIDTTRLLWYFYMLHSGFWLRRKPAPRYLNCSTFRTTCNPTFAEQYLSYGWGSFSWPDWVFTLDCAYQIQQKWWSHCPTWEGWGTSGRQNNWAERRNGCGILVPALALFTALLTPVKHSQF